MGKIINLYQSWEEQISDDYCWDYNPIAPEEVRKYVYSRIDFKLPIFFWNEIDVAFGKCWNDEIGVREYFDKEQIEYSIFRHFINKKIIFSYDKIGKIVDLILQSFGKNKIYSEKNSKIKCK